MSIKSRLARLESRQQSRTVRYTIFDVINGTAPENVDSEDIEGWAELEPAIREAVRAAEENSVEARMERMLASVTPIATTPENHDEL